MKGCEYGPRILSYEINYTIKSQSEFELSLNNDGLYYETFFTILF